MVCAVPSALRKTVSVATGYTVVPSLMAAAAAVGQAGVDIQNGGLIGPSARSVALLHSLLHISMAIEWPNGPV